MKKVLSYLKPYTFFIIVSIVFTFIQAILSLYLPDLMSKIVNNGVVGQSIDEVLNVGKEMVIVTLISMVSAVFSTFIASKVSGSYANKLRSTVFSKVEKFSLKEFDKISTSSLITRTTNDVTQIQQLVLMSMRLMVMAPLMCIGGIIMAVKKNLDLSILFIVVIPMLLIVIVFLARKIVPLFTEGQKRTDKLNQVVREKLTGVRVIRAFGKEEYERGRYDKASKGIYDVSLKASYIMSSLMPFIFFVINVSTVAIVWFGAKLIGQDALQIGDMMAFMQYAMQVLFSILMVTMIFILIPKGIVSSKRIGEVLSIEPSILDNGKKVSKDEVIDPGVIEFENVEFKYDEESDPVLSDINFKINKGETLAIIGGTGCGKTTLLNLMLRFYDTTKGNIKIGGFNIRDISIGSLRDMIGFVPQKVNLFSGTIAENIRYGKTDATEEELKDALETSQSLEFVSGLENGLDSMVAQGGTNFSGGQKQRISIARAIVKKPQIYLFDDSFSALDYTTDKKLREALNEKEKDATFVIVAQRVSTVLTADKIIFLDEGKIIAQGTHKELYNSCEAYKEVVLSQITEEEATQSGK
jgi:ATP-binding cassette subfamily B protein